MTVTWQSVWAVSRMFDHFPLHGIKLLLKSGPYGFRHCHAAGWCSPGSLHGWLFFMLVCSFRRVWDKWFVLIVLLHDLKYKRRGSLMS